MEAYLLHWPGKSEQEDRRSLPFGTIDEPSDRTFIAHVYKSQSDTWHVYLIHLGILWICLDGSGFLYRLFGVEASSF
jgi:hypothetical protein